MEDERFIIKGKDLDRYFDLNKALFDFHEMFTYNNGDERAIAIVGATFLDTLLEHILLSFLPEDNEAEKLLEYNQPLGTYGNKVIMTYSLGLIEKKVRDDLKLIGKIRNKFAHDLYASFNDPQIISWCKELKWHKVAMMRDAPDEATIRDIYQVGVNTLISNLHGVVSIARGEKRKLLNNF